MASEQRSVGRQLDYSLGEKTLGRLRGATEATANIEKTKLKGKRDIVDTITGEATRIGMAIDSGAKRTKKLVELGEKWDNALSKDDWGTAEAMQQFRAPLLEKQELYIQAVKTGNKADQEKLLQELNGAVEGLEGIKTETNEMTVIREKDGHIEDPDIVSYEDRELAAVLAENSDEALSFNTIDGTLYRTYDNTDSHLERTAGMDEAGVVEYVTELFDRTDDLRTMEGLPEDINSQLTGHKVEDTQIIKDYIANNSSDFVNNFKNGDIRIKRNINANGINKLSKRLANPKALQDQVRSTLAVIQEGASAEKATYFDPKQIKNKWAGGFTREDQKLMMTMDVGFDAKFKEDFMEASVLDMPIPITANIGTDADGSGVIEPDELPTNYTLTRDDKELIIKEMMKPEHFELAKDHWSTWAMMKSAQVHNTGVMQRFTEDDKGVRTAVVPPDLIGSGMYGGGYYDPSAIDPATGKRYDAQTMASSQMDGAFTQYGDVKVESRNN